MGSPVSIGDAILLSQLAYQLGKTLSIGRKLAPTTHTRAQNQLFALSHALRSIAAEASSDDIDGNSHDTDEDYHVSGNPRSARNQESTAKLQTMLEHCDEVLERLRALIEKYTSIGQSTDKNYPNRAAKWRAELKNNLKKVKWSMKEGDVEKLQRELAVHIDSLTLVMSGSTK